MNPKKIIIAIDSFKGCLSSTEAAKAIERGIHEVDPDCPTVILPIADGGEGTVEALIEATEGSYRALETHNPLMQPLQAGFGILGDRRTAVIEMSAASGLSLIPLQAGNVMHTTTYGTGELIKEAIFQGCREIIVGVGGSATNDAGIGMLQALGFRFLDSRGATIPPTGAGLLLLDRIETEQALPELKACTFHILTDVKSPFYGPQGAACIFAPQKGADARQVQLLDEGLQRFARLIKHTRGISLNDIPGTGAGGGLAGGCLALLNARIEPGIEVVKRFLHFDEQLQDASLILTGEGKIDHQTEQGKVIAGILASAHPRRIPVIALTGNCEELDSNLYRQGLTAAFAIHPSPVTLEQAMDPTYARKNLQRLAADILRIQTLSLARHL